MSTLLLVGGFGLLGVLARFAIVSQFGAFAFPFGTLAVNGIGSFLAGILYAYAVERALLSEELRVGIAVGFLGGFTTFSAFALEIAKFVDAGRWLVGLSYALISTVLGVGAVFAGLYLGRNS